MKELNDEQLEAVTFAYKNSIHDMGFYKSMERLGLIKEEFEVGKWYKLKGHLRCYSDKYNHYGFYYSEWDNRQSAFIIVKTKTSYVLVVALSF